MSKLLLLHSSLLTTPINRRSIASVILSASNSIDVPSSSSLRFALSLCPRGLAGPTRRSFSVRAFESSSSSDSAKLGDEDAETEEKVHSERVRRSEEEYPSGEFRFEKPSALKSFVVKLRMLVAFPWERVRKGSVLTMKLRGQVSIPSLNQI